MNDRTPPREPDDASDAFDDELASAVLDDEAAPDERRRVADDPRLTDRVAALARVRAAVGDMPPPASPAARDRAIAAALHAGSSEAGAPASVLAPVVPGAPRRRRQPWLVAGAVAASAAVILGIATIVIPSRDRDTGGTADLSATEATDTQTGAGGSPTSVASGATTAAGATTTAGGASSTAAASSVPESGGPAPVSDERFLGELAGVDDLRRALVAAPLPARDSLGASSACPAPEAGSGAAGLATWRGVAAIVFVLDGPPRRAVVLALNGCQELAEATLA